MSFVKKTSRKECVNNCHVKNIQSLRSTGRLVPEMVATTHVQCVHDAVGCNFYVICKHSECKCAKNVGVFRYRLHISSHVFVSLPPATAPAVRATQLAHQVLTCSTAPSDWPTSRPPSSRWLSERPPRDP
jgi:hypothetical protein